VAGHLTREQILQALQLLAVELPSDSRQELFVMGGAALVLLFGARQSTKDVDVLGLSPELRAAASRVAGQLSLPSDWLNDAAKGYAHGIAPGERVFEHGGLVVRTLAVPQLLAMKLSAWRDDLDIEDAMLLLARLHGSQDEVWRAVQPYVVPGRELKASYAFADLWEARDGHS
jgi:hypothetical protein